MALESVESTENQMYLLGDRGIHFLCSTCKGTISYEISRHIMACHVLNRTPMLPKTRRKLTKQIRPWLGTSWPTTVEGDYLRHYLNALAQY